MAVRLVSRLICLRASPGDGRRTPSHPSEPFTDRSNGIGVRARRYRGAKRGRKRSGHSGSHARRLTDTTAIAYLLGTGAAFVVGALNCTVSATNFPSVGSLAWI